MSTNELRRLLRFYKALGDENRLKLFGLLHQREHNVGEMATMLGVKEPTVSHHLSKLRDVGLVNLRVDGNLRYYRANRGHLKLMRQLEDRLRTEGIDPQDVDDHAWIDALDLEDWERKILRDYTSNGRLKQIPTKELKLLVVLNWLSTHFEAERIYTEQEVNAVIGQFHEDYATLRRDLVEFGYLRRERGGRTYWLTPEDEAM